MTTVLLLLLLLQQQQQHQQCHLIALVTDVSAAEMSLTSCLQSRENCCSTLLPLPSIKREGWVTDMYAASDEWEASAAAQAE